MFDPSWNSAMQVISDEQARQAGEPLSDRLLRTYAQRNDAGFDVLLREVEKLSDENGIMRESLKLARITDARCEEVQELLEDIERECGHGECRGRGYFIPAQSDFY